MSPYKNTQRKKIEASQERKSSAIGPSEEVPSGEDIFGLFQTPPLQIPIPSTTHKQVPIFAQPIQPIQISQPNVPMA